MESKYECPRILESFYKSKSQHPDAICMFRVGDFYEMYERDAIDAAKILGIIVRSMDCKNGSSICVAGFPSHALDTYLPKLIRAGRKVAIHEMREVKEDEHEVR